MHLPIDILGFFRVNCLVNKANIDNAIFKTHYKLTTSILFACCALVTTYNALNLPIICMNEALSSDLEKVINTYCWISHTFTLPNKIEGIGTHVVSPGVSSYVDKEDEVRYHSYYQWVPFMLFFQGIMFYFPYWLWKNWEEGKIDKITYFIRGASIGQKEERIKSHEQLVKYLIDSFHTHNIYALGYFLCEVLNFLNVVGNVFLIDCFLGGEFYTFGMKVLGFNQMVVKPDYDPMEVTFPRLTKCLFQKYGPSGTIQTLDMLCILPLNIINEKIYFLLWFWFIILVIVSSLALAYSIALITLSSVRETILLRRFKFNRPQLVSALIRRTQIGDFFLLHLLGQNMERMQFIKLLDDLSLHLQLSGNLPTAPSMNLVLSHPPNNLRGHREKEA